MRYNLRQWPRTDICFELVSSSLELAPLAYDLVFFVLSAKKSVVSDSSQNYSHQMMKPNSSHQMMRATFPREEEVMLCCELQNENDE
jgi:hypothetical protein